MNETPYEQKVAKFEEAFGMLRSAYSLFYNAHADDEQYKELRDKTEKFIGEITDHY